VREFTLVLLIIMRIHGRNNLKSPWWWYVTLLAMFCGLPLPIWLCLLDICNEVGFQSIRVKMATCRDLRVEGGPSLGFSLQLEVLPVNST
jgi:hypothetical protein